MPTLLIENWKASERDFPENGATVAKLKHLLEYAVLAPSSRNAQPWLFRIVDDAIELQADRSRALPVIDPHDREMFIACGAALFHLRVAIRHFGYGDHIETFPNEAEPDLLARVRLGERRNPSVKDEVLFEAMPKRHTNRLPFSGKKVPEHLLAELEQDARAEGASLFIANDLPSRFAIASYIAESDNVQWGDPSYRHELAQWMRENDTTERDGLPGYAMGMGDAEATIAPLVLDAFDLSNDVASKDYKLALSAPTLAMLWTERDDPASWLTAGQALARILLRASSSNVSSAFFNQPIEVAKMRARLADVTRTVAFPQLLFRMGYGPEVKATPRRSVDEVLI